MNAQVQVSKKPVSKMQQAYVIFRAVMADTTIAEGDKRKTALARFQSEVGLSLNGSATYYADCKARASGNDPHAGRKLANKKAREAKKAELVATEQAPIEEPQQPPVDLSNRWLVGTDKDNLTGSFKSRAEAQKFAKDNGIKWFDATK